MVYCCLTVLGKWWNCLFCVHVSPSVILYSMTWFLHLCLSLLIGLRPQDTCLHWAVSLVLPPPLSLTVSETCCPHFLFISLYQVLFSCPIPLLCFGIHCCTCLAMLSSFLSMCPCHFHSKKALCFAAEISLFNFLIPNVQACWAATRQWYVTCCKFVLRHSWQT